MKKHKMVLGIGGGTRSRHVYSIAIDLGLPTGLLSYLGGATSEQNAHMVQALLAKYGVFAFPKITSRSCRFTSMPAVLQ